MSTLTDDVRPAGTVRAFEPRLDRIWTGPYSASNYREVWKCRGRVANTTRPITRYTGKTVQCAATLDTDWRWCPKCGGLLAWGGVAIYNGTALKHLQRTPA